ncbi:DUF3443 domain-containing protein [Bordetella genomosp. 13]|uniref:DUF3443 domain-containing protein n=1 Tax=Bordetella genomosp. 13 TaxID=463040 RepID=UPI00119CB5EA|nr:DUF3443 domain-containing protein [Bordetella genomosp. 13]
MNTTILMRKARWVTAACLVVLLAACGGGGEGGDGGDDGSSKAGDSSAAPVTDPNAPLPGSPSAQPTSSSATNAIAVTVSNGADKPRNFPTVSVTVCAPGTDAASACATIDNVLVDTGSYGLRLFASAVPAATLATLAPQRDGAARIAECTLFVDSNAWGGVRNADIRLGAQSAQNVPVHIWSDPAIAAAVPDACVQNTYMTKVSDLGGNGILGVGVAPADCPACANTPHPRFYYSCNGAACTPITQPLSNQVGNPVARFAQHNNGVVLQMEPIGPNGKKVATGTLVFGIDTADNNVLLGKAGPLLRTNSAGDFDVVYKGNRIRGFTDSGSNGLFFSDAGIPHSRNSPDFYAPSGTQSISAMLFDRNAPAEALGTSVSFDVANADALFNTGNAAFNNLGGDIPGLFDLGLPFFYGRHVYYGLTGMASTGGGTGPYVSYVSN